jgi:hypothetical protein
MERPSRVLPGGCLALMFAVMVSGPGCRSTRNDVPPGKPYSTTGGSPPTVGFNSDPHPNTAVGVYGNPLIPGSGSPDSGPSGAGSPTQFGIPAPGANPYGAPSSNRYGPVQGTLAPAPLNQ